MLNERLAKQMRLYKGIFLFILYNRAALDCTNKVNVLNPYKNFAAMKLRHCGGSAVTQLSLLAIGLVYMVVCNTQWKAKQPTYVSPAPGKKRDTGARNNGIYAPSTRTNPALSGCRRVLS